MTAAIVPPLVAALAAVSLTLQRFVVPLLIEFDVDVSAPAGTHYTLAARFASFLFVYGVLLGAAYWAGRRDADDDHSSLVVAGATAAVAAAAALVASVAVLQVLGWGNQTLFVALAATAGQSASTGVQLGVVAFAGLAAGSR